MMNLRSRAGLGALAAALVVAGGGAAALKTYGPFAAKRDVFAIPSDVPLRLARALLAPTAVPSDGEIVAALRRTEKIEVVAEIAVTEAARAPVEAAPIVAPAAATIVAPAAADPSESFDLARFAPALTAYRRGDEAGGDSLAAAITDPLQRAALEWVALRTTTHPNSARLAAFAKTYPDWPSTGWLRTMREALLYNEHATPEVVRSSLADNPPQSVPGKLALARAALATGKTDEAASTIRAVWRNDDFETWHETAILREFANFLGKADHKYRADRLLYAEKVQQGFRTAAMAGADQTAVAQARFAAMRGPLSAALVNAVPAEHRLDPAMIFARVQTLRRGNRSEEAATLLAGAPKEAAKLIDGDKWWTEQRMVARQLLDLGKAKLAYEVCSGALPVSSPSRVDAGFHAGWIALRFLHDAKLAKPHFDAAAKAAETALSIARASYWQGRAAEDLGDPEGARAYFQRAAQFPIAYYGQLASQKLGRELDFKAPAPPTQGENRAFAIRAVDLLYAAGAGDLAKPLAYDAARRLTDPGQLGALAEIMTKREDGPANVSFGKIIAGRGMGLGAAGFPLGVLPTFQPLTHSADLTIVYAIARQESEFAWRAASGVGAKGLMQIMPATAVMAARKAGVPYDYARLIGDPVFNTQLGAEFLGQVLEEAGGSKELAFAAYNAGGGRVQQWVAAYGDPRTGTADLIDWIERIPYDETRDYVQRVSENLAVYKARMATAAVEAQSRKMAKATE